MSQWINPPDVPMNLHVLTDLSITQVNE